MGSQKNFCLKQGTPLKGVTSTVFWVAELKTAGAGWGGGKGAAIYSANYR